mgnify:CR=1 FL=1
MAPASLRRRVVGHAAQDRQREGRSFARASLSDAKHVATLQEFRNGLGLDRRRLGIAFAGNRTKNRLGKAEFIKVFQSQTFTYSGLPDSIADPVALGFSIWELA